MIEVITRVAGSFIPREQEQVTNVSTLFAGGDLSNPNEYK